MATPDLLAALEPVVAEFERLGVRYFVAGSVASAAYGMLRATQDVDVVTDLALPQVAPLLSALGGAFYGSRAAAEEAVGRRSCFNLIHLATMFKVDVFVVKDRPYDRVALQRRVPKPIEPDQPESTCFVGSPEDIVLAKLEWFRPGNQESEQQWRDVVGVIKIQRDTLDWKYMAKWAAEIGVGDLLEKAREVASH
jgi:hypothetical protein